MEQSAGGTRFARRLLSSGKLGFGTNWLGLDHREYSYRMIRCEELSSPTAYSSENKYSRSALDKLRANPSSPRTSAIVWALLCCSSQIFSSTVPGEISR